MTIAVLDYGAGNLRSVQHALEEIGAPYVVTRDAAGLRAAEKIIFPGVGHFGQMMQALETLGVRELLRGRLREGVPCLGICLGMQALFRGSAEAPGVPGLGVFDAEVVRFGPGLRVPHMGWDEVVARGRSRLLEGAPGAMMYFAHSYYAPVIEATVATCTYGTPWSAVIEAGPVCGVQFHPEKSGRLGLGVVRRFVER